VVVATGSSASRSLGDRFGETVNVKDFGAVGDGVTSDSAAIEAAFAACPSGGCIYFPPTPNGYRITYTCRLYQATNVPNRKKNITFLGENTKIFRDQPRYPITASAATDIISCPSHNLTNGQVISFCNLFNYSGLDRVIVSGAGTSAVDGTYNPAGWYQTRMSYSNGTYTLRWDNQLSRWEIVQGSTILYRTSDNKQVPWNAGSWVADTGAAPAPSSFTRQRDIIDYGPNPERTTPYAFLTGNIYYVRDVVAGQSFKISETEGGPALDITIDIESGILAFPITSNGSIFTAVGCGYTENQGIRLIGTGNPNIDANRLNYAVSVSGDTFGFGFTQFWAPPVNHGSPVTQGIVVAAPFPLFEIRNTEGYQFEGINFDGGEEFCPFPLATNPFTQLLSYTGILAFANSEGFLPDELCNNISIRNCSFTNANCHGIGYGVGAANLPVVANAGTAGVDGEYFSANPFANINGRRFYTKGSFTIEWRTTSGGYWAILSGSTELYKSNNASTNPWDATGWTAVTGIGTPTVTLRVDVFRYRGDNFSVQECLFRNLDAAIVTNINAPRRLSFNDNHILDGQGRQYLDPALWAEGLRPFPEWFTWAAGGSAIVLMGDLRAGIPETREDPYSHTSHMWTISGNVISNWGQQGGEISGPRGLAITGNVIEKTGYGLSIVGIAKGIVVSGNSFRSNTAYDLEWGSFGGVVTGNYFDGRAWNYTNTDSTDRDERSLCADGIIIYGPEFYSSSPAGFGIPAGADNVGTTITGNTFVAHRTYSIRGWSGASNTVISGNIFQRRSNGNAMVTFWNPANNIVIDGNSFIHRNKSADPSINPVVSAAIGFNGGKALLTVSGIVGSGTTAVATTTSNHAFFVGDVVTVANANEAQFNGTFTITLKTANTFTYTMTSSFTGNATTSSTLRCGLAKYMTIDRVRVTNNVFEGDPYGNAYVILLNDQSLSPSIWVNINDLEISGNASPVETATPRGVWVGNTASATAKYTNIRIRNNSGRIESSSLLSMRFDQTDARENNIPNTAPTFTPTRVGDLYFNNSTQVMYISIGTSSSADWQAISFWQP
jgi:hypothetical protein